MVTQRHGAASILLLGSLALSTALASVEGAAGGEEPMIDHQPVECSVPGKNARICAYVLDDGEIKRVRTYFRAEGEDAFYWSDMAFDGIQFCATLPVAKDGVRVIDYYVWAVDDEFQTSRTREGKISLVPTSPCAYPVVDDDPQRTQELVVHATSEKQGDEVKDFEPVGIVQFHPVEKK